MSRIGIDYHVPSHCPSLSFIHFIFQHTHNLLINVVWGPDLFIEMSSVGQRVSFIEGLMAVREFEECVLSATPR